MVVNNEDQRPLIKEKMEVNIKWKRHVKFNNLKAIRHLKLFINKKFKAKVKDVLDL
jgi:hypothetical protein